MDATNAEVPAAGGLLSGEASKLAAIKRLRKQTPSAPLPKPERSYPQMPGQPPSPKG